MENGKQHQIYFQQKGENILMSNFNHDFILTDRSESRFVYQSEENTVRLDFVSKSCLRVAAYKNESDLLPTFNIDPQNKLLEKPRERLSVEGFKAAEPFFSAQSDKDSFILENGIKIELDKKNFLLSYFKDLKPLFADRAPLAYNFGGEFGSGTYHYVTRSENEYNFGLGDKGGALDKTGRSFRIETSDAMGFDAETSDPLYKHIPFYMCKTKNGCYGIFYDTADDAYMDMGREINNYYPPFKFFKTDDNCLVYYVFFGSLASILAEFSSLCGKQAFPPKWSFDYCASTMAYTDAPDAEKQMNGFLKKVIEEDLNCQGFYLSSGYTSIGNKRCVFNWNREKFPNPKAFVNRFEKSGIHLIPNIKPAFLTDHPMYDELAKKGCFVKNEDGTPYVTEFWDGLGSYLDFTNPEAFEFWSGQVNEKLLENGIDATWNDNNEFDIKSFCATAHGFGKGKVEAKRIKPYLTYLMNVSSYKAQTQKEPHLRPFLSTRSGGIAVRRFAQTWSGDNKTSFHDLRFCHNIGLTLSLSGLSFYGHDLGGFHGPMPSKELLVRWLQHGVFEPRFTVHSWNTDGSATMPWSYEEAMPTVKKLFAQRKRLLPYLYSCAYDSVTNEMPLNAPPLLYYDDEQLLLQNDSMMVGRDILAAFVFDEGSVQTRVWLPSGETWHAKNTTYSGGKYVTITNTTDDEAAFFVRGGSVIATDESPAGFNRDKEDLLFTVYTKRNEPFESTFFSDDGESYGYLDNDCVKLHFSVKCSGTTVRLTWRNDGNKKINPKFALCPNDRRRLTVKEEPCSLVRFTHAL